MELGLTIIAFLIIGLGLFQGWMLWFIKREHARLDHRIDESLDAEDLVEFQERLQALLGQARDAGAELVQTLDKRGALVDKTVEKAREAEQKLFGRLQAMERLVDSVARHLEAAESRAAAPGGKSAKAKASKPAPKPARKPMAAPPEPELDDEPEAPLVVELRPAPEPTAQASVAEESRRSYVLRPALGPVVAAAAPSRHQKIYDLADQGLSREQIAREAGVLAGEVDLILNLRRQRRPKA
jgi:hypothetical protein